MTDVVERRRLYPVDEAVLDEDVDFCRLNAQMGR
jgi:hypothetical protein